MTAIIARPRTDWLSRLRTIMVLRPGQRVVNIPGGAVSVSRRAVSSGNGLMNNLVAYWPLNEAAGANNALDLHTNGLTLTQVSSPGADTGKVYSTARTFDGSADYFSRTSEALLQVGDVDFTLAAWVYITNLAADRPIAGKINSGTAETTEYGIRYVAGIGIRLSISDGTLATSVTATSFGNLSTNVWYLVFGWHDALNNSIGVSVNSIADTTLWASGVTSTSTPFFIGARPLGSLYFTGRIGPVAMWKSAAGGGGVLTAAQRTALYNAGAGLPYASFTV